MQQDKRKAGRPHQALTQQDIVAAAAPLFAARGLEGVSLRELGEQVGIRKASLLHHFASKEALYVAVIDEAIGALTGLIVAAKLDEGAFPERLDRLGELVCAALAARPETARLLLHELVDEGPYLSSGGGPRVQATLELTAAFLEAGMEAGAFRREDPRQLALSIVGLHLLPFAAARVTSGLLGADLFSPGQLAARRDAVLGQVRALCLPPATLARRPRHTPRRGFR